MKIAYFATLIVLALIEANCKSSNVTECLCHRATGEKDHPSGICGHHIIISQAFPENSLQHCGPNVRYSCKGKGKNATILEDCSLTPNGLCTFFKRKKHNASLLEGEDSKDPGKTTAICIPGRNLTLEEVNGKPSRCICNHDYISDIHPWGVCGADFGTRGFKEVHLNNKKECSQNARYGCPDGLMSTALMLEDCALSPPNSTCGTGSRDTNGDDMVKRGFYAFGSPAKYATCINLNTTSRSFAMKIKTAKNM